jgi:hypothetical protein
MALVGLTGISEISQSVALDGADHITAIRNSAAIVDCHNVAA